MFATRRLNHLTQVWNHFGVGAALLRMGDRVLQVFGFEVHKVLHQDSTLYEHVISPDPRCTFRRLTPEDVESLATDPENRIPASFAERLRSERQLCFASFCDGKLATHGWYALGSIDAEQNAGVTMAYPADTACLFRGFTHPDFRGQLIHGAIRPQLLAALAEHGITKIVALVSWTNWPSLRYCYRVGYRDVGYLITIGPRRHRLWFAPVAPPNTESGSVQPATITLHRDEASPNGRWEL